MSVARESREIGVFTVYVYGILVSQFRNCRFLLHSAQLAGVGGRGAAAHARHNTPREALRSDFSHRIT